MPFLSKIRLNGTLYDLKVAGDAMVTGVKGDAESDYRVGDVNITPENVGTISTENTQSLTDTQKSTARDNLGLGSAATRSVPASGNANATQVVLGSDTRLTGSYKTDDTASTTINDTDYIPMSDADGTKKKTLWSTIVTKIKTSLSKSDVGLGNVPNVSTNDQTPTFSQASTRTNIASGEKLSVILGKIMKFFADLKSVAFSGSYTDLTNKPNYALSPSAGGAASNVYTTRTNGDYNADLPGAYKTKIAEHTHDSPNRPSDHWYFVVTMQGGDTNYATQVAYGMTTTNNYTRLYQGGTWGAWKAFRNPTGNATAAQVLSGYTFSNASSDGLSGSIPVRSNGVEALAGGVDGTGAYLYFPNGYYPASPYRSDGSYTYVSQAILQNMHQHSATWTPSSSQYNSSQAEIATYHSYRYVNTAVCYAAGVADGRNDPRIKYDNEAENVSGGYKSYAVSGLTVGATYGFFLTVIQWSGTFQGVGSGASVTMTNGTVIGATPGYKQVHCRSSNAGNYGGMVITSRGQFTATATTTYLTFDLKTDQGLFYADWQLFVFGT